MYHVVIEVFFLVFSRVGKEFPRSEFSNDCKLPMLRQQVYERQHDMHFKRRKAIRRLHPIAPSYAGYFRRKTLLIGGASDMFNYRIAEDNIERSITKRQQTTVGGDVMFIPSFGINGRREIDDGETRPNGDEIPDLRRAAHVEYSSAWG